MLCFTRKLNETIQISGQISITVLSVRGQMVRLGIEAPKECNVVREELITRGSTTSKETPASSVKDHKANKPPKVRQEVDRPAEKPADEPKKPKVIYKRRFRAYNSPQSRDS
jgi:carbon storage regulator